MARQTPAEMQKAKEARQKKIAIVGAVLLVVIGAIQVPRTLKLLNGGDEVVAAPPAVTSTTGADGGLALPPVEAGETGAAAGGGAADGAAEATVDGGPAPVAGQLVTFTRFASKDPFVQQLDGAAGEPAGAGGAKSGADGSADGSPDAGDVGTGGSAPGGGTSTGGSSGGSATTSPTRATIAVGGVRETVSVGGDFPAASPLFRLVGLTAKAARIGIAGGSYAGGEAAQTVALGRTLVLQNTADGTRYELTLVSVG
jgi:hypothetical protein